MQHLFSNECIILLSTTTSGFVPTVVILHGLHIQPFLYLPTLGVCPHDSAEAS